mgnify:CR=1 FL=1
MRSVSRLSLAVVLLLAIAAFAAKEFLMPKVYPAKTYPAHDDHPMEKFAIAADPYDIADKASIFTIKYGENGMLPVLVVFTNYGDQPVSFTNLKVELVTRRKDKISPADEDDLYRRFSKTRRRGDEGTRNPFPIPLPRKKPDVGVKKEGRDEIDTAMFAAKAVAPGETESGFMFFDVSGISQPLAGAHLYISGLENDNGQELMYFDIPMEKYLSYTPPGTQQ